MKNTKNKIVSIHPTGQVCGFSRHESYKHPDEFQGWIELEDHWPPKELM